MVQISLGRVNAEYKAGDYMKSADDENKDTEKNAAYAGWIVSFRERKRKEYLRKTGYDCLVYICPHFLYKLAHWRYGSFFRSPRIDGHDSTEITGLYT